MKKFTLFTIFILLISFSAFNQKQISNIPISFTIPELSNDIDVVVLPTPDINKLIVEDSENIKNGTFDRVGVALPCNLNFSNSGTWEYFQDGSKLWRLQIVAENAVGLGIDMQNFYLPEKTKLFIYSEDRTKVLGEFTIDDNIDNKFFSSDLIKGQSIIVEYFEAGNINGIATFDIIDVSYIYRNSPGFNILKDFGDSDPCEVNINCPEGDNWQNEKKGVARILTKVGTSLGWCTGSFINNQRVDCTPYFLTADHCGEGASATDMSAWKFYFSWDADSCFSTNEPSYNYTWGCTYFASGGNGGSTGSDFYLVKLNKPTYNAPWDVYFNGWDRSTTASGGGVCIHHPAGDIMKISTYTSTPVSSQWNFNGLSSHWKVYWSLTVTNKGVTEGGSSGSPLFNNSKRIIGDLTGGGSYCTQSSNPDYYGKFSYSWESNGTTSDKQLKPWLDPDNTGVMTVDGISYFDCITLNEEKKKNNFEIKIFPNPTNDYVTIAIEDVKNQSNINLCVFNIMGEMVYNKDYSVIGREDIELDFNSLDKGVYMINVTINDRRYNEKVILIK